MSTATDERWWTTAPNPVCVDWCDRGHAADDFADGGGLSCSRTLINVEGVFEVVASSSVYADDEQPTQPAMGAEPPVVAVYVWAEVLTPDQAFTLAQADTSRRVRGLGFLSHPAVARVVL